LSEKKGFLRHKFRRELWRILTLSACILFLISTLNPFVTATPKPRFVTIDSPANFAIDAFWSFKVVEYSINYRYGTRTLVNEGYFWNYLSRDWSGYTSLYGYGYDSSPAQITTILLFMFAAEISTIAFVILALLKGKSHSLLSSAVSSSLTVLLMWLFPLILNGTYVGGSVVTSWFWFQHYVPIMLIASTLVQYRTPGEPLSKTVTFFLAAVFIITLIPTILFFQGIAKFAELAIQTRGNFQTVITEDYYGSVTIIFRKPTGTSFGFTETFFIIGAGGTTLFLVALFFLLKELKTMIK
jgi:hypothetical protein